MCECEGGSAGVRDGAVAPAPADAGDGASSGGAEQCATCLVVAELCDVYLHVVCVCGRATCHSKESMA